MLKERMSDGAEQDCEYETLPIAIVLDQLGIGGTELNALRSLEALERRGTLINVLHFQADGPLRDRLYATRHAVQHVPVAPLGTLQGIRSVTRLRAVLKNSAVRVAHSQCIYSNVFTSCALALPGRNRPAHIASRRWQHYTLGRGGIELANRVVQRRASVVTTNSPQLLATLRSEGVQESRIAQVPNFISQSAFDVDHEMTRQHLRTRLGIPEHALVVGCVARLRPVKRHEDLLRAFHRMLPEYPESRLVLVGDGPSRAALEALATELAIAGRVVFAGEQPNTPLFQHAFDISVLASETESMPNAVIESGACGVPVIATDVGGTRDAILDGKTGLLVPVCDPDAMSAGLRQLCQSADRRRSMGDAGREYVRAHFSEAHVIDSLMALYARTISRAPEHHGSV